MCTGAVEAIELLRCIRGILLQPVRVGGVFCRVPYVCFVDEVQCLSIQIFLQCQDYVFFWTNGLKSVLLL